MESFKQRLLIGEKNLVASLGVWGLIVLSAVVIGLTIWASVTGDTNEFRFD